MSMIMHFLFRQFFLLIENTRQVGQKTGHETNNEQAIGYKKGEMEWTSDHLDCGLDSR
jgi:hypothetical protein